MTDGISDDVLERMSRARAARADDRQAAHPAIVAMMAGAGARLVTGQNKARMILAERVRQSARRRAEECRVGSGSRPEATPVPVSSIPATVIAGALSRQPETHRE